MTFHRPKTQTSDRMLLIVLICVCTGFTVALVAMVMANVYVAGIDFGIALRTLRRPEIHQAIWLSIGSSVLSTVISLWVGTAIAFLISRYRFFGRLAIDLLMDLPIFLPPLVIGISLLTLFRTTALVTMDDWLKISFHVPAVILVQSIVGIAFVYRTMKATFDQQTDRPAAIARTLGASRWQILTKITLPDSRQGLLASAAIAWARAFGEFGPVLVFAGSFRGRTEVLPVSIYLELNSGNLAGAAAISILMIVIAGIVFLSVRLALSDRGQS